MDTLHCKEVQARLAAYLDGEIAPDERRLIDAHLASCAACRKEAEATGSVRALLKDALAHRASAAVPPPRAWEKIRGRIEVPAGVWYTLKTIFQQPVWRVALPVALTVFVATSLWGVGQIARPSGGGSTGGLALTSTTPTAMVQYVRPPQYVTLPEQRGRPAVTGGTSCFLTFTNSGSTS